MTSNNFKRVSLALHDYTVGEISLGKAAELAGLTVYEFLEEMRKNNVALNLFTEDVLEATKAI